MQRVKQADPEEVGGWRLHSEVTGFADQVADTDAEAIAALRRFLSYLPSHHGEAATHRRRLRRLRGKVGADP